MKDLGKDISDQLSKEPPIFEPPDDKVVEHFARAVCEQYAQRRNEPNINSPEIVNGLSMFLRVLMRIEAKLRNQSLLDTGN